MTTNLESLQQVIDASVELMFVVSPDSKEILISNKSAQSYLGRSSEELRATKIDVLLETGGINYNSLQNQVMQKHYVIKHKCLLHTARDTFFKVVITGFKFKFSGKNYLFWLAKPLSNSPFSDESRNTTDVTLNQRAENLLKRNVELDYAYAKSELAYRALEKEVERRKRVEEELRVISTIDSLTKISNRHHFNEEMIKIWGQAKRDIQCIALILLDIDFFKKYNDNYGHLSGDNCLFEVAKAIRNCLSHPGDLFARYGGEEFVIVLPHSNQNGALKVAESVRIAVEQLEIEHKYGCDAMVVTVSIGVAVATPSSANSSHELLDQADHALYQAKELGRNQIKMHNQ